MDNIYERARAAQIAASYGIVPQEIKKSDEPEIKETQTESNTAVAETIETDKPLEKSEQGEDLNKGVEPDDLQKGDIADALISDYGNANATFKFEKTGKQLKEMLPKTIAALSAVKDTILAQLGVFQTAVGAAPTESYSSYRVPSVKVSLYPYELTKRAYNELTSDYEPYTDAQVACNSYNDLAYRLRSVLEDIAVCQLIVENAEDTKKYNLSVSQLVAINLGQ